MLAADDAVHVLKRTLLETTKPGVTIHFLREITSPSFTRDCIWFFVAHIQICAFARMAATNPQCCSILYLAQVEIRYKSQFRSLCVCNPVIDKVYVLK